MYSVLTTAVMQKKSNRLEPKVIPSTNLHIEQTKMNEKARIKLYFYRTQNKAVRYKLQNY